MLGVIRPLAYPTSPNIGAAGNPAILNDAPTFSVDRQIVERRCRR
jgi:hypothetical protein